MQITAGQVPVLGQEGALPEPGAQRAASLQDYLEVVGSRGQLQEG